MNTNLIRWDKSTSSASWVLCWEELSIISGVFQIGIDGVSLAMRKYCIDLGWGQSYRIKGLYSLELSRPWKSEKLRNCFTVETVERDWRAMTAKADRKKWHCWHSWLNLNRVCGLNSSVLLNCSPDLEAYVLITLARVLVFRKHELECSGVMQWHICSLLLNGSQKDQWLDVCVC